jgi:predicted type IV restriction endonuclease
VDKRIKTLIQDIRSNERITTFDEATTKQAIILRLLSELGWHIFNTEEVKPEYSVSNKRVDYALRINNTNKVFLEIKKVTEDIERHQNQLLEYSFQEGI